MLWVKGTEGYAAATERFVVATHGIAFQDLHQSILQFIPTDPSHVLDVGSGIGRDAAVLAEMGHTVVAVEPTREFSRLHKVFMAPALSGSMTLYRYYKVLRTERKGLILSWHQRFGIISIRMNEELL